MLIFTPQRGLRQSNLLHAVVIDLTRAGFSLPSYASAPSLTALLVFAQDSCAVSASIECQGDVRRDDPMFYG